MPFEDSIYRTALQKIVDMGAPLGRSGDLLGEAQEIAAQALGDGNVAQREYVAVDALFSDEALSAMGMHVWDASPAELMREDIGALQSAVRAAIDVAKGGA